MKITPLFKRVSEILSICIFLSGSVVLTGWIFDIPVLKSVSPNFVTMKANAAICFIFIGLSLWLSQTKWQSNRTARGIARFCAFAVFMTGFLTFWEYMLGWDFGIDQLLFKESATAILTSTPGRMAFNTSIIFGIIGVALLLCGFETVVFAYLAQLLVIPAGILALLSFLGYLYGASPLYIGLKFSTAMAVHTCVLFLISCIGCLFVRPHQGFMKNISSDNYGGLMLRRILPVVIVIPPLLGWLKIHGTKIGLFGNEFGVSFVATFNLVAFSLFVYMLSVRLNMLDAKRRQIETVLQTEKDNLEAIFEASPVGMFLLNEKAAVVKINGVIEKLFGKCHLGDQPGNLLGCTHSLESPKGCGYSPSCPQCPIRNAIKTVLQKAQSVRCAEVLSTLLIDGQKTDVWLEVNAEPIVLDGGKCVIVAINNISERKKAEKEMKEAVEMKARFISTASHELRTPLTAIKEGINLVHSEVTGPLNDDQKEFLGIAKSNVDRLARLINDVLDLRKISAGRMVFDMKPASINEAVTSIEETMRPLTKEKGLDFIIELDGAVPFVNFDKDKIIQVLTNLVNNALKFTEKGSIKITTSRYEDSIRVSIQDSGDGIKQEDIPRLFQEFEQLATADSDRKIGGTGLGLAISKKIIENHGGKIWAESDYGKGTTFYFELPMEAVPCQIKS